MTEKESFDKNDDASINSGSEALVNDEYANKSMNQNKTDSFSDINESNYEDFNPKIRKNASSMLNNQSNENLYRKNYRKSLYNKQLNHDAIATGSNQDIDNDDTEAFDQNSEEETKSKQSSVKNLISNKSDKNSDKSGDETLQKSKKVIKFIVTHPQLTTIIASILFLLIIILFLIVLIDDDDSKNTVSTASNDAVISSDGIIQRGSNNTSYTCSSTSSNDFSVSYTSLSEDEFVEALKNGKPFQGGSKGLQIAASYAHIIYKKGIEMGVNPELAVLRADIEGYAPSIKDSYSVYNNYWGFGCENGKSLSTCTQFSSFEKGVERLYNWVIKYRSKVSSDSYYEVFHDYAYIGDYWNKGSAGDGGCYYKNEVIEQLEKMGETGRIEEIKNACSTGNVISTNNVDQDAYARYQTKIMMQARKNIFGISGGNSNSCFGKKVSTDINGIINKRLNNLQGTSFAAVLKINNTSIDLVNNQMYSMIMQSGPGTREAVATAGKYLVSSLAAYGYSLPYMFYGGHDYYATNSDGVRSTFANGSYYGINPFFGSTVYSGGKKGVYRDSNDKTYEFNGLDCSGFVGWALHNGGLDFPTFSALDYLNSDKQAAYHLTTSKPSQRMAKVGDVMSKTPHHAALIIDVNYSGSDPYITYLEEVGDGLVVTQKNVDNESLNKFTVINMDYVYKNFKTQDFSNKFNNGLIKEG